MVVGMVEGVVYHYRSPVGTFWIASQENDPGCWYLGVVGVEQSRMLRWFHSAQAAVLAVGAHFTGFEPWDSRPRGDSEPRDLSGWVEGPPKVDSSD